LGAFYLRLKSPFTEVWFDRTGGRSLHALHFADAYGGTQAFAFETGVAVGDPEVIPLRKHQNKGGGDV